MFSSILIFIVQQGSVGSTTTSRKSFPYKKGTPGRRAVVESPAPVPVPVPTKVTKSSKAASTGFKVKVPAKRTPQISMHLYQCEIVISCSF